MLDASSWAESLLQHVKQASTAAEEEAWEAYCDDHSIDIDDDEAFETWRSDR